MTGEATPREPGAIDAQQRATRHLRRLEIGNKHNAGIGIEGMKQRVERTRKQGEIVRIYQDLHSSPEDPNPPAA